MRPTPALHRAQHVFLEQIRSVVHHQWDISYKFNSSKYLLLKFGKELCIATTKLMDFILVPSEMAELNMDYKHHRQNMSEYYGNSIAKVLTTEHTSIKNPLFLSPLCV